MNADRTDRPTVVVVGGGISGLAAAWELTGGASESPDAPRVVVLEGTGSLGGKLRTAELEGRTVDLGPDGFLARRPEATTLCREVGLGAELMAIGASGASVWVRGRRRRLPDGLVLGVPTRFWPAARSGILGAGGSLRLLLDVLSPRPDVRGPLGDRAIGPLVGRKLGQRVVDRLVDPLVGGIHAGNVGDMSAAAVFPLLLAAAQRRGSFMRALRRAGATPQPSPDPGPRRDGEPAAPAVTTAFWALERGMGSLVDRLAARLVERGVVVRTGAAVELLDRGGPHEQPWVLHTPTGPVTADGVVLAVPAPAAAALLEPHDSDAATLLGGIEHASVALVTLCYPAAAVPGPLEGTGFLVPHATPAVGPPGARGDDEGDANERDPHTLVTACTYLDHKWPHLRRPGSVLVRASVGRFGDRRHETLSDAALIARVGLELEVMVGTIGEPAAAEVTRFPAAFPQYRVHHLLRVAGIESALGRLPAIGVAGAAYRGVGIPACIASGRTAARGVLASIAPLTSEPGPAR